MLPTLPPAARLIIASFLVEDVDFDTEDDTHVLELRCSGDGVGRSACLCLLSHLRFVPRSG